MLQKPVITDWTAGELSDLMSGRTELDFYQKGCSFLENWVVLRQGCITNVPGIKYIATVKGPAILVPFIINDKTAYTLEIGPRYIRIYDNQDAPLMAGDSPLEIPTDYATIQHIREIQIAQDGSKLYLAHSSYRPMYLECEDAATWTFGVVPISGNEGKLPFLPLDTSEDAGNWPSSVAIWGGRLWFGGTPNEPQTVWASETWNYSSFKYVEIVSVTTQKMRDTGWSFGGSIVKDDIVITGVSDEVMAKLKVGDAISASPVVIVRNGGEVTYSPAQTMTWYQVDSWTADKARTGCTVSAGVVGQNYVVPGHFIRIKKNGTQIAEGAGASKATAAAVADMAIGDVFTVELKSYLTAEMTLEKLDVYSGNAGVTILPDGTNIAALGTNAIILNNPAQASLADGSFIMSWANPDEPQLEDHVTTREVTTDSSAMKFLLGSEQLERIQWMASGKDLVIGGSTSEFIVPAGVTALQPQAIQQTRNGSARVQGMMFKDSVVFVQGGGKRILDYPYSNDQGAYKAPDLTYHAEGVLGPGVIDMDFTQTPQPMLLCVRSDGELAILVYDKLYQVMAWSRIVADGAIESVAVNQDLNGDDVIYVVVNRNGTRYLGKFGDLRTGVRLNCFSEYAAGTETISGLSRFPNGTKVKVVSGKYVSDGEIQGGVVEGEISLEAGEKIYVGIAYTCVMRTNRITTQSQYGVGQGNLRRVSAVNVRFLESYPVKAGYYSPGAAVETALFPSEPFTGLVKIPYNGDWDTDGWVSIIQDQPRPVTILSLMPEVDAT